MKVLMGIAVVLAATAALVTKDPDTCIPQECKCYYAEGRPTTDCANVTIPTGIPRRVKNKTMVLILNGVDVSDVRENNYLETKPETSQLVELHMSRCHIEDSRKRLWRNLHNLRKLVLSHNQIKELHSGTFNVSSLRVLDLSYNRLTQLGADCLGAKLLEDVDLSHNGIQYIFGQAFEGLLALKRIKLNNNQLDKITFPSNPFQRLPNLETLDLLDNPWYCDCHLREFIMWQKDRYLIEPPTCQGPQNLRNKRWDLIADIKDFACGPLISEPDLVTMKREKLNSNVVFECRVSGDPLPTIEWRFINNTTNHSPMVTTGNDHLIIETGNGAKIGTIKTTLTIMGIIPSDVGHYQCVARNAAGTEFRIFDLQIADMAAAIDSNAPTIGQVKIISGLSTDWLIVIVVLCATIIIILTLIVAVVCYRRQQNVSQRRYVNMNGHGYKYLDGQTGLDKNQKNQLLNASCDHGFGMYDVRPVHVAALEKQKQTRVHEEGRPFLDTDSAYAAPDLLTSTMSNYNKVAPQLYAQGAPDDSGYLDAVDGHSSQGSSSRYATLPPPKRSSPETSEGSSPNSGSSNQRRHSLPNARAPLANLDLEPDGSTLPLRETAL